MTRTVQEEMMAHIEFYKEKQKELRAERHDIRIRANRKERLLDEAQKNGLCIVETEDFNAQLEQIELDLKLCKSAIRRLNNILKCFNVLE